MMRVLQITIAGIFFVEASATGADWPRFRGPNGVGVSETEGLPVEFHRERNLVWRTELPMGMSSPVLWGDRVFLTGLDGDALYTYALDRYTGRISWRREAPRPRVEKIDRRNHPASATPAVDADAVYAFFPDFGVVAYGHDGVESWRAPLGPFRNVYGMGASPIVVDDTIVLVCDQSLGSFVVAYDRTTGAERWRTARPEAKSGHSTPVVWSSPDGGQQVLVPGSFLLSAYDVATGERLWWVRGLSFEMKSTPVLDGDMVYVNGFGSPVNQPGEQLDVPGFAQVVDQNDGDGNGVLTPDEMPDANAREWFPYIDLDDDGRLIESEWQYYDDALATTNGLLGIRLGGRGDVTETNVRWTYHESIPQLPSPVLYRDVLYMVNDGGIATSLRPESGEAIRRARIPGARGNYYASPVAADGKVFMSSQDGKVAVLVADATLAPLAVNDLGEEIYATPAIADGRLYIRTNDALYCFGSRDD